jgi:hypothetical protein
MRWFLGFWLAAGLLLAGSDGELFPLPNLVGMVLIAGAAWVAERRKFNRRYGR